MDLNRWPVYEFRPLPGTFRGEFRRYANGAWLPDDGEHDVAFIGHAESGDEWTFPCCLYIDLPYYENIVCSWLTGHWSVTERRHPRGNAWHHALREGATEWGEPWGRDSHLNYCAGSEGMAQMSSENGCSNGRLVEMHANDPHIAAGLLRERDTNRVFTWPESVKCMYCGDEAPLERSPCPPLNERIARLLEPVPVFEEGRCLTEAGWWKRDMDFGEWTDPVPMHDFPACVDTSLMVIEAKWPKCHVSLFWSDKRQEYVARISDIRTEVEDREIGDGEGVTRAEALALALCAALEAEVK